MSTNAFERPLDVTKPVSLVGNLATLICPMALPPGSRVSFQLQDALFNGKIVHLAKHDAKHDDSAFLISVRLNTVSNAARAIFEQTKSDEQSE